jgi:hypothetical protein
VLLDTGVSQVMTNWGVHLQTDPLVTADTIPMTAQTGVIRSFRSGPIAQLGQHKSNPITARMALNYVTGSHAFKVGFSDFWGRRDTTQEIPQAVSYRVTTAINGTPNQITEYANARWIETSTRASVSMPGPVDDQSSDAQRWSAVRLLQVERSRAIVAGHSIPPRAKLRSRGPDFLDWKDPNPRLGVAYDFIRHWPDRVKGECRTVRCW